MMKLVTISALSLAMLAATPVLADGDRGRYDRNDHRYEHRKDYGSRHFDARYERHYKKADKHWRRDHDRYVDRGYSPRGHVHGYKQHVPRVYRYARDHRGHYYRHPHGHYVIHKRDGHDYYKWIGGAILLSEILHHSNH